MIYLGANTAFFDFDHIVDASNMIVQLLVAVF